ncbi:MAG: SGNH/GDSL hydrolase family protein [Sporolactobacillus sp.]
MILLLAAGYFFFHFQSEPKQPAAKKNINYTYHIVALGDSLTQGVGDPKDQGYVGLTAKGLKKEKQVRSVTVVNYGHMGDTTADLLNVVSRKNVQHSLRQSNTIFLTIGGNDIVEVLRAHFMDLHASDFTQEQKTYAANLSHILAKVRSLNPRATIYFFGLYNPFEDYFGKANKDFTPVLDRWNLQSKQISKKYRVQFMPTAAIFKGKGDSLFYTDHFHPNKNGYEDMSALLLRTIQENR